MDISQVPGLVEDTGSPLIIKMYEMQDPVYPLLGEVLPITDDVILGERGNTLTGIGRPKRTPHGTEIPADQFASGITWRLKVIKFTHRIEFPFEFIRASNAAGRIANIIAEQTKSAVTNATLEKEDYIADMFQKGTLTAGDKDFFDGSYPNETDTNPKFIYDGLPWFDTAHTLSVGSDTFSNHTVTAALNQTKLEEQDTLMSKTSAVDERGERIRNRPDTLLVPTGGTAFTAEVLLGTAQKTGSANNDKSTVFGKYRLIEWDALDDAASASAWWLGNSKNFGLRIRDSGPPVVGTFTDDKKEIVHVKWVTYFGAAITDWRGWSAANKAAS